MRIIEVRITYRRLISNGSSINLSPKNSDFAEFEGFSFATCQFPVNVRRYFPRMIEPTIDEDVELGKHVEWPKRPPCEIDSGNDPRLMPQIFYPWFRFR
jgi:hypothetical protein